MDEDERTQEVTYPDYPGGAYDPAANQLVGRQGKFNRPTVRQELDRRIAEHQQIIKDLEAAKNALTPEIETALNALRKVGI
jgi:hypothetical protein